MNFIDVENKEKYFIQPFIEGERLIINVKFIDNEVHVKAINKKNKQVKLLKRIENEIINLYKNSKFYQYEIILKGFLVLDKKKKNIIFYDLMLKNEYDLKTQSKRYNIRLENLNIRFLKIGTKYVKSIFSFPYNEKNLEHIINQFIKSNKINSLVFHKDIPYKYDDEIIVEDVCTSYDGKIIDCIIGTTIKRINNEETNEIESEEEIPCINYLKCLVNEEEVVIPLDNFLDSERIDMFQNFDKIKDSECQIKSYNILNKNGFFIVKVKF